MEKGRKGVSKRKRIGFSVADKLSRNKIAVQNSQVNLNYACRKGRKTTPLAVRPGQILNIDRARAIVYAFLSVATKSTVVYFVFSENTFYDTSYGETLGLLLTKISVK